MPKSENNEGHETLSHRETTACGDAQAWSRMSVACKVHVGTFQFHLSLLRSRIETTRLVQEKEKVKRNSEFTNKRKVSYSIFYRTF